MRDTEQIVDQILMMAYDLLVSGLKVGRTEKQIAYICHAYGMDEVEFFTITSSILVSVLCLYLSPINTFFPSKANP